jgi:hypothetical protein
LILLAGGVIASQFFYKNGGFISGIRTDGQQSESEGSVNTLNF